MNGDLKWFFPKKRTRENLEKILESVGQLYITFAMFLIPAIFIFSFVRVLFSIAYLFGKLIFNAPCSKKIFTISKWIGVIALHIPIFILPIFVLTLNFFHWKNIPGWFGEPISIPFFLVGTLAAMIAGIYSPYDEYDFWNVCIRLR